MCGIWILCGMESHQSLHCNDAFTKIAHRGPDAWRLEMDSRMRNVFLGFHRLSIVDGLYGMQPMQLHKYPHITLLCNGEIYNCQRIQQQLGLSYETKCDVECIIHLYATLGIENTVKALDGVFAFVIIDAQKKEVHIARDPYGVRPAFILKGADGILGVCSEAKGLISMGRDFKGENWKITPFRPGCYETYEIYPGGSAKLKGQNRYYEIGVTKPSFEVPVPWTVLEKQDVKQNIRELLTAAVEKRLMSDRRIGCLLSGGLDSSLVAALLVRAAKKYNLPYKIQALAKRLGNALSYRVDSCEYPNVRQRMSKTLENGKYTPGKCKITAFVFPNRLLVRGAKSFSIGMGTSPDVVAARQVADFIGTEHHEVIFSEEDVANLLDDVIYTLETPDITTIRASLGMYLLSRYIKDNTDSTVIFSGEGADEIAQGYIYFRDAPSAPQAHDESVRLLKDIYLFDGLRADRTTAAHSLELRLPFLDQQFSSYYLSLPPESRQPVNGVEKHLLRDAFTGTNLIPENILWRHKEAFSDGVASVSKSLFEVIHDIVDKMIPDSDFTRLVGSYTSCPPKTKEALYYRMQFEKTFPNHCEEFMGYFWMPKWIQVSDPSARFISHYAADKDEKK